MKQLSYKCVLDFTNPELKDVISQVKEIFFLSSSVKSFDSPEKKDLFFKKWCGDYLDFFPENFFIYIDLELMKVYGYICGVKDTTQSLSLLKVPGLSVFEDLYDEFPAHLHINFHPEARGMGLGSKIVGEFINYLKIHNVQGLHLVTSKDSDNTRFYNRLGFNQCLERSFNGYQLYFMGMRL